MPAGQMFTKTWRIRNTGTCTWGEGYTLEFVKGHAMTSQSSYPIPRTGPGGSVDLSVLMKAPATSGAYQGHWVLKNPQGVPLAPALWVKINVP